MAVALLLVTIALLITLGLLVFGTRSGTSGADAQQLHAEIKARELVQVELDRKRKDVEEQKAQLADAREQLKQAKRKLFDQKEAEKGGRDLARAREETERHASLQLEVVRSELAAALADVERLKVEISGKGRRLIERPEHSLEAPVAPAEPKKRFRELNDAEREKMERLEHEASKERGRSQELDREVRRLKGRTETQNRVYLVVKGELDLVKDKFKALEKRLNRTLLESDLLRRALRDLEKKSGIAAERTELTQDEIAASDRRVEERALAEAVQVEQRRKRHAEETVENAPQAEPPVSNGIPSAPADPKAPAETIRPPLVEPV